METSFWIILYVQQNLKRCVAWALPGSCAKCVIFKDTSWTEILHVVAEFHSTVLHRKTVSSCLMEKKWVSMFNLHWRASKFHEDKGWFLYKKIIYEAPATRKKLKKSEKKLQKSLCNVILFRLLFVLLN